jgi:hypothetical protein
VAEPTRRSTLKGIAAAGAAGAIGVACARRPDAKGSSKMSAKDSEGGEAIRAVIPLGFPWQTQDPFIFCVHHDDHYPAGNDKMGPAASLAGRNLGQDFEGRDGWRMYHGEVVPGFPQHPHRGFETVTVVRRGLLDHSDSVGAAARYGEGDVQWLTAGGGILHSEMFPLLDRERPNPLELFQIWLNLPSAKKMVEPYFAMLWSKTIPHELVADAEGKQTEVTLVAGRYGEAVAPPPPPNSWAAAAEADVAIWTIRMPAGARFTLPAAPGTNRTLYFFRGSKLRAGGRDIPAGHGVELDGARAVALASGPDEIEMLLLQGRPIGEPVVAYGPFVMTSRAEIQQAFADYQRTQFGGWPWPSHEPVHPREEGRFARRPDGKIERPT